MHKNTVTNANPYIRAIKTLVEIILQYVDLRRETGRKKAFKRNVRK